MCHCAKHIHILVHKPFPPPYFYDIGKCSTNPQFPRPKSYNWDYYSLNFQINKTNIIKVHILTFMLILIIKKEEDVIIKSGVRREHKNFTIELRLQVINSKLKKKTRSVVNSDGANNNLSL